MSQAVHIQADPTEIFFAKDAAWHLVDIASGMENPEDCVGVMLRAQNVHGFDYKWFGACGCGSPTSGHYLSTYPLSGIITMTVGVVADGGARNVYLKGQDSNIHAYIAAEFYSPGAFFFETPYDVSPTASDQIKKWQGRICHHEGEAAYDEIEATILNIHHHAADPGEWGARWWGATADFRFKSTQEHMGYSQLCKVAAFDPASWALYQIWCDGKQGEGYFNYQEFTQMGFIRKDCGFRAVENIAQEGYSTTSGWETRTCSSGVVPEHASGMIGQLESGSGINTFGARSIGSTPAYAPWKVASNRQDTCFAVELNSGLQFELYAESGFLRDVYVHGYTYPQLTTLDLGVASAVVATSGEVDGGMIFDCSPAAAALVTSGELGGFGSLGLSPAVAALVTSGELGGFGSLGLSPAVAALVTSGELGGFGSLGLSPAVAALVTSGELGGFGSLGLSPAVAALVTSGGISLGKLLQPSPAVAELFASGVISEPPLCEWFDSITDGDWHTEQSILEYASLASGGWLTEEGAEEFAVPAAGEWLVAADAEEFAVPAAGGWRAAEEDQEITSPGSGGWFDAEDAQDLTSPADDSWRTRKPCG